eukprot:COSAG02_NODE_5105_length_4624_cov_6.735691_1_plen_70_part_00
MRPGARPGAANLLHSVDSIYGILICMIVRKYCTAYAPTAVRSPAAPRARHLHRGTRTVYPAGVPELFFQ